MSQFYSTPREFLYTSMLALGALARFANVEEIEAPAIAFVLSYNKISSSSGLSLS
jgi:hypothetical protein